MTINEYDQWLGVELRHLAALEAVAEEGSFGRAARRLGYTQSAVSQQIAHLEKIVGARLLERPGGPRAVSLTDAGRLLLRHADAIVARLAAAARARRDPADRLAHRPRPGHPGGGVRVPQRRQRHGARPGRGRPGRRACAAPRAAARPRRDRRASLRFTPAAACPRPGLAQG